MGSPALSIRVFVLLLLKNCIVSKKKKEFGTDLLRELHSNEVVLVQPARYTDLKELPEPERLRVCEEIIDSGLRAYFEIGRALLEIQESRLYRDLFPTFEAYCADRWNIARRTAYQLIDAYKVVQNVRNCAQVPATESQARVLGKLPAEYQELAWREVLADSPGTITAKFIAEKVDTKIRELGLGTSPKVNVSLAPTSEELALAYVRKTAARTTEGIVVKVTGKWILANHLSAYWILLRQMGPEAQISEDFVDEITVDQARELGLVK
jgi:hypothetical protein